MQGFAPARRVTFVSAKVPKTILARARPLQPCSEASSPGPLVHHPESRWLRNSLRGEKPPLRSNSLRQRSRIRGGGPAAPNAGEEAEAETKFSGNDQGYLRFFHSVGITAFGCGGAGGPNRLFGESCLSGASSLAILFGAEAEGPPWGRARAKMVLVTFAETKVTRRAGTKPRIKNS